MITTFHFQRNAVYLSIYIPFFLHLKLLPVRYVCAFIRSLTSCAKVRLSSCGYYILLRGIFRWPTFVFLSSHFPSRRALAQYKSEFHTVAAHCITREYRARKTLKPSPRRHEVNFNNNNNNFALAFSPSLSLSLTHIHKYKLYGNI